MQSLNVITFWMYLQAFVDHSSCCQIPSSANQLITKAEAVVESGKQLNVENLWKDSVTFFPVNIAEWINEESNTSLIGKLIFTMQGTFI